MEELSIKTTVIRNCIADFLAKKAAKRIITNYKKGKKFNIMYVTVPAKELRKNYSDIQDLVDLIHGKVINYMWKEGYAKNFKCKASGTKNPKKYFTVRFGIYKGGFDLEGLGKMYSGIVPLSKYLFEEEKK